MKTHPNVPALVGALAYPGTELASVLKITHVPYSVYLCRIVADHFTNRTL